LPTTMEADEAHHPSSAPGVKDHHFAGYASARPMHCDMDLLRRGSSTHSRASMRTTSWLSSASTSMDGDLNDGHGGCEAWGHEVHEVVERLSSHFELSSREEGYREDGDEIFWVDEEFCGVQKHERHLHIPGDAQGERASPPARAMCDDYFVCDDEDANASMDWLCVTSANPAHDPSLPYPYFDPGALHGGDGVPAAHNRYCEAGILGQSAGEGSAWPPPFKGGATGWGGEDGRIDVPRIDLPRLLPGLMKARSEHNRALPANFGLS